MPEPPRARLNPAQALLLKPGFLYFTIALVAALCVVDLALMVPELLRGHVGDRGEHVAIRLIALGVYLELRGDLVAHLRGQAAAEADLRDRRLSETCEDYGAHLTVGGLFVELIDATRSLVSAWPRLELALGAGMLGMALLVLHALSDLVRALWRTRHEG